MKRIMIMVSIAMVLTGCGRSEKEYDGTGVFEATEVTVSAEGSGRLLRFAVEEGDSLAVGSEVGLIDTTQIYLKMRQAEAKKAVYASEQPDMEKQIAATRQRLAKARQEQQRYKELVNDGAAPRKMLDDASSEVKVLERELEAQVSALRTSVNTLTHQMAATEVEKSQLRDQLEKCRIVAPLSGTVIEKYVEQGEFVAPGTRLFKMGDLRTMYLRAYVTSARLADVKVGQKVKVFADYGGGKKKEYAGTVSWISSRSEFTPKTIVTDDERADLVYALKIAVSGDGKLKIGMYGEVKFD